MRIGEVADQAGVSPKTIRHYEHVGLLNEPSRTESGYRDYDKGVLARLAFIRTAQAVGFTLAEVRSIVALRDDGRTPCDHVANMLSTKAADLDRRIAELRDMSSQLHALVARAQHMDPTACDPDHVCHLIVGR